MKKTFIFPLILAIFFLTACSGKPRLTPTLSPTPESSFTRSPSPSAEVQTTSQSPEAQPTKEATKSQPTAQIAGAQPTTIPGIVIDDFEKSTTTWQAAIPPSYNDSSALKVEVTTDYASQGKSSLALTYGNDQPKAIFVLEGQFDASKGNVLAFELNDPQGTVAGVAIAVCTGGNDWYWHESAPVAVQPGTHSLAFDLTASTYKTAASNWEPTTTIANRQDVRRYVVILYLTTSGTVYLDNFRLLPAGAAVTYLPTTQPPEFTPGSAPTPPPCPGKTALPESSEPLSLSIGPPSHLPVTSWSNSTYRPA